ncbi:trimeric intracellular cation channel family protein [Spongisporangium articulatum]|uniref:Trimeric intracellular cation channel family protein n=1 Tax=Spongisporangium articulatum TaxID=3362603 RepID=A0ABW8AML3_9ACTN
MLVLDLVATLVFGVSGGLTAVRLRLDVVGVLALATLTGLGGGWIRDVLIGVTPPAGLADWRYLTAPMIGGLVTFFLHPQLDRINATISVVDAFGLGLFSVAGALKAVEHGLGPLPSTLLGLTTGVGGGVLRDIVIGVIPTVLRKGELYAIPAVAGAGVAVLGSRLELTTPVVAAVAASVTTGWRLLALWRGWTAPEPVRAAAAP